MQSAKKYGMRLTALGCSLTLAVTLTGQGGQSNPDGRGSQVTVGATGDDDAGQGLATPSDFGIQDEAITMIPGFAFRPRESGTTYDGHIADGRWVTGGLALLYAPLTEIPNGADVTQVSFHIEDTHATADFQGRLCRHMTDSETGANPDFDCPLDITSVGTGQATLSGDPNITILYRGDVDADVTIENVSYTLSGGWGTSTDGSIKLRHVRLLWRRQVSPAPGFATFADVPVGDPLHRFVEALAAAGITGGCGGGNYCPNQAVTRGQMAVFISAALGLHWPAF